MNDETLMAVSDVLVLKALEAMGKRIVRADRSRFREIAMDGRHFTTAHMMWPPAESEVDKVLASAWDVVPAVVAPYSMALALISVLDSYVRDLVITGTEHTCSELAYRLDRYLAPGPSHAHAQ
jgi:hypothetical protein